MSTSSAPAGTLPRWCRCPPGWIPRACAWPRTPPGQRNWKRWGPYLSERQWGTVREDYSADGDCWDYFPHDHARSRAYRWGEDGLLGIATASAGCASRSRCGTARTRS